MPFSTYLKKQADRCLRLSRSCFDLTVAEQLRVMADDFRAKAQELDERSSMLPAHVIRAVRGTDGDRDRD